MISGPGEFAPPRRHSAETIRKMKTSARKRAKRKKNKAETFVCASCSGTFEKGRPDKEALSEMEEFFGPVPEEHRAIICDDCFQKMHPDDHPELMETAKEGQLYI
jgi:hypothetical protein